MMRKVLNTINMDGVVVIGEGEKDEVGFSPSTICKPFSDCPCIYVTLYPLDSCYYCDLGTEHFLIVCFALSTEETAASFGFFFRLLRCILTRACIALLFRGDRVMVRLRVVSQSEPMSGTALNAPFLGIFTVVLVCFWHARP